MGQSLANVGVDSKALGLGLDRQGSRAGTSARASKSLILDASLDGFDRSMFAQEKLGKIMDNYDMLEELGSGSFGVVNRGKDFRNDCYVAIKTLPKKKVKDPQKLKAEFNTIRQLDHPHICKAYECYEDRKNIYLVIELLLGGTLLQTLCRQNKFTEADASNIARQILSALAYLHTAGFIFRDLKTENVMFISPATEEDRVEDETSPPRTRRLREIKLIDFGLCCPFEKGSKMCKAAGTPYSVAPELVTAPVQYDQKCDAWSAGVVIYIMLSGKYPFNGKTKDELLHAIRKEPCSFTHPSWKRISKDSKNLLADLLKKKSDARVSVNDAIMYSWLKNSSELPTQDILLDVVDSFNHFQDLNMFEKAAVTALAWRASDEDTAHLRHIFESLDRDGNGHITVQELRNVIEQSGIQIPHDLEQLAVKADTDGGGTIEYTEFIAATLDKQKVIKEEVIWEAFRIFDSDGSGTITKQELLKILTGESGDKIRRAHGNKAVDNFLDEYDVSGDAVIDFEEFMEMLQGVKETYTSHKSLSNAGAMTARSSASAKTSPRQSPRQGRVRTAGSRSLQDAPIAELSIFQRYCWCSKLVKEVLEAMSASGKAPIRADQSPSRTSPKAKARQGSRNLASPTNDGGPRSSRRNSSPPRLSKADRG